MMKKLHPIIAGIVTALGDGDDAWWRREDVGAYLPPLSLEHEALREFLRDRGWLD